MNGVMDGKLGSELALDSRGVSEDENCIQEGNKRVSLRKRKPNSKYSEDNFVGYDVSKTIKDLDGSTEEAGNVAEEMKVVSSRKRKPKPKYNEDEDKAHLEELLKADVVLAHILEETKQVLLRKRNQNTCYGEDSGISRGKKGITLHKRNPNPKTNYNENVEENVSDYSSDTTGENGSDGNYSVKKNPRKMGERRTKKISSKKICEKSQLRKLTEEYPQSDGMLSQLYVAARDPMEGYSLLSSLISFFTDYKNSVSQGPEISIVPERSEERMTKSNFEPGIIVRETNGVGYKDEKTGKDYTPTAVILFFADEDSVPSKSDLHHIFDCYGTLIKVNTEVVKRLKRARVVFKRRSDADMAFKSTGRFSIFGPSLISYRLSYFY